MSEKEGFFLAIPQLARKYHSLYDKVYAMGNLREAWDRVRKNKGAGGVDGESIQLFQKDWERNLAELQRLLKEKRYVPPPVRRHYIPKPDGRMRPLGIPTVRDRIVQQAVKNILEPIFEPQFKDCSVGFRPGRSAHDAAARLRAYAEKGYRWVVDADIQGFFDNLDHGLLLQDREGAGGRWECAEAHLCMADSWSHGGGRGADGGGGNAPGWGDLAAAGEHLPGPV